MRSIEVDGLLPNFRYKISFSQEGTDWVVHHIQLLYKGAPILPRRRLMRPFPTEDAMIEHAFNWCDTMTKHIMFSDVPAPGMPVEWEISVDQLMQVTTRSSAA